MNANSLEQMRAAAALRDGRDDRMDQVRQLLVGDHVRDVDARMLALEQRVRDLESSVPRKLDVDARLMSLDQRLHDCDGSMARKLDTIAARIDGLAGQLDFDRRAAFADLSQGILELSERIRAVSKGNAI